VELPLRWVKLAQRWFAPVAAAAPELSGPITTALRQSKRPPRSSRSSAVRVSQKRWTIFRQGFLIDKPGGLLVEVTDGTADYNASRYRLSVFYDLAKVAVNRLAFSQGHELGSHGAIV
jgi:hypothetical protein